MQSLKFLQKTQKIAVTHLTLLCGFPNGP